MKNAIRVALIVLTVSAAVPSLAHGPAIIDPVAKEVEANLRRQILGMWYPRAIDRERGGYQEGFDTAWKPAGSPAQRSIVYQARLTWCAAEVSRRFPDLADSMRRAAQHGLTFLRTKMWDREKGGFYWQIDAVTGQPTRDRGSEKHAYGIAFGIYASAAVYRATKDPAALDLARRAYAWLDSHAHDSAHGGYYEAFTREGKPILNSPSPGRTDAIGTRYGYKSMNSHIHLLEALTELYLAKPDPAVKARLLEVFRIVRDRVYVDPGCLHLYFNPDWRPVPDHDSFGHDVETAYLLTECAEALGIPEDSATWRAARRLVDHALEVGWDTEQGAFFDHGTAFGAAEGRDKVWWTEAEGLNALLLMHERFGSQNPHYWLRFLNLWSFIQKRQVDSVNFGWYSTIRQGGDPAPGDMKSDQWKDPYHQGRALMNVLARLKHLSAR